jgi:hypothetical protein
MRILSRNDRAALRAGRRSPCSIGFWVASTMNGGSSECAVPFDRDLAFLHDLGAAQPWSRRRAMISSASSKLVNTVLCGW